MASAEAEIITLCDKNHAPLPKYINPEYVCKESSISLATVMFKYLHERDNAGDKANETLASRNNGLPKIIGVAGGQGRAAFRVPEATIYPTSRAANRSR